MVWLIFEGKFEVKASGPEVWEFIIDPTKIGKCLPDLKNLEVQGEDRFVALVRVGVGPIKADFKFKIEVLEKTPINHARLKATGSGSGSSIILDTAIELTEITGGTQLSYRSDVKVGGIMAGLGQRVIKDTADKTISAVFDCVRNQLG